jgi:hypothetical protein
VLYQLRTYVAKNQDSLKREGRFVLILCLWVGLFVAINRDGWKSATELSQRNDFSSENQTLASNLENRVAYWEFQAQKIGDIANRLSPLNFKQQLSIWKSSLEGQADWLATHVVAQRKGFEPSVTGGVFSSRIQPLLSNDTDSPVPWQKEINSNAMQIAASLKANQSRNISRVRSLKGSADWIQIVFKNDAANKDWRIWVIHTLSEQFIPTLLEKPKNTETALFNKSTKRFIFSDAFISSKINEGELKNFINSRSQSNGSEIHQFVGHRKPSWVAWTHMRATNLVLVSVLPNKKIPTPMLPSSPAAWREFFTAFVWLVNSYALLRWTFKKGFWRMSLKKHESTEPAQTELKKTAASINTTQLSGSARELEFCSHLLSDFGPAGELRLSGLGTAKIEAIAAESYKGSWWTLKSIDKQRSFIAIGDTSGQGIAAGAASYTMKFILEKALSGAQKNQDNEELLKQLFNLCTLSAEGALLNTSHVAIFMAIISLDSKTMTFINAGYPAPMLVQNAKKKVLLIPDSDPLGLGTHTEPMPRWVNLTQGCRLSICNVGVRNSDLPQLDDSELIKITVSPFGEALANDEFIDEDGAA